LAELEDSNGKDVKNIAAFKYHLIDVEGIDEETLNTIKSCPAKTELLFHWIEQMVVENMHTGIMSIPAPILTRAFQELSRGLIEFYDAMKISQVPFPFPYAQVCDSLLLIHWCLVPFVACSWVREIWWGAIFSFVQVFFYWSLTFIAVELENPFGMDDNDLNAELMQEEGNAQILMLLQPSTQRIPQLSKAGRGETSEPVGERANSFHEVWSRIDAGDCCPRFDRATFSKALASFDPQERERAVSKINLSRLSVMSRDTLSIPDELYTTWEPLNSMQSLASTLTSTGDASARGTRAPRGSMTSSDLGCRRDDRKGSNNREPEETSQGWHSVSLPVSMPCKGSHIASREASDGGQQSSSVAPTVAERLNYRAPGVLLGMTGASDQAGIHAAAIHAAKQHQEPHAAEMTDTTC